jgi:hypothetical protein
MEDERQRREALRTQRRRLAATYAWARGERRLMVAEGFWHTAQCLNDFLKAQRRLWAAWR